MCLPVIGAAVAGAASIAGGVMRAQQQQQYVEAVNASKLEAFNIARMARQREEQRQDKFSRKGFKNFRRTVKATGAESQAEKQAGAEQEFLADTPVSEENYVPEDASAAVQVEAGKTIADSVAKMRGQVGNLAKLSSFATVSSGVNDRLQKNADLLSILNNKRRGSLGVYQQEASIQPEQINPPDTTFADILTGLPNLFGGGRPYG